MLRPAPIISASQTYHLGSVFVPDEYPLRHTPNRHVPEDKLNSSLPMNEIPSFRQARAFDPRADISHLLRRAAGQSPKVRLSLGLNKEVTFRYSEGTVTSVDPVPLRDSLKTIHCVADIASKPVLALAIIYSVQEHYASQGGIKADVKVAMKDDDIVFRYGDNGKFVLEDKSAVPRIWALIPFLYHVEGLSHDWKLRRRREFVENKLSEESDEVIPISTPDLKGVVFRIE